MTLNTLDSSSSFIFKELFISTEEIEPTPTLVTLYTGNPVVDQTPGLAWINSETMKVAGNNGGNDEFVVNINQ